MLRFRRRRLSAETIAFVLAAGVVANPAAAQSQSSAAPQDTQGQAPPATDAPITNADAVQVVGYRESLRLAQDYKKSAVGSEDDILAQDIGSFPDMNLAESLQRVPGVTITRDSGEGRQITLRGLGPDFTRTQLNGMEVLGNTASGMDNLGAVSRSRSFDYSLFASELFNRVSVQKSYSAEQDEGGIAGTVGLYTAKPFDYPGAKFMVSAKEQTNSNTDGMTPRVAALASNHWGDFGALISVAYSQIKSNEYGYRNWGWGYVKYNPANIGPGVDPRTAAALEAGDVLVPQAESPSSWWTDRKRLGITSSLQYHPGETFKLDVDLLYGRLQDYRNDYALAAAGTNALTAGNGNTINGSQVLESANVVDNTLVSGSYSGVDQRSEHHIVRNHTDFYQAVANASWEATDRLTFTGLAGYEESDFRQPEFDKVFLESKNHDFSFDDTRREPSNSYGFDLTDPNQWGLMRLDTQENAITSKYRNAKLAAAFAASESSTFKLGGDYKDFTNTGYQYNNKVFHNPGNQDTPLPSGVMRVIGVNSQIPYIAGNVDDIYKLIGDPRHLGPQYLQAGSDFGVEEKTGSGFFQYDLDTDLFGMRLRANAGIRYYATDLTSTGHLATMVDGASVMQPVTITSNSRGWLPAANLALSLSEDLILRVSADRNVNRPGLTDLEAAGSITTRPNGGSVSFGNPLLKPYQATSYESSLEYYMDGQGFASIGVFYKRMDSFITSQTRSIPFSQTGLPTSLLVQGEDANTMFDVSQPINGPGADIKGIEGAFQHDFTFLPGVLKHLGANVNGTWFDGHQKADIQTNGVDTYYTLPLFNLSKWAFNATLYYENSLWGVRVSDAYRSKYVTGYGIGNIGDGYLATNNVDFQAHWTVNPHLKLVLEGINLTNQPIQQVANLFGAQQPEVYTKSGRIFSIGATMEF